MPKIWLITGTARDVTRLADLESRHPGRLHSFALVDLSFLSRGSQS